MINWIKKNKNSLIRVSFLIPIILVMIISISHVTSWYGLSNPITWSVYLSLSIEIAAMSSIAAASVRIKGGVWLIFIIVTFIQFIGNIFFSYKEIDINNQSFKDWVELVTPVFELMGFDTTDMVSQRRWLALLSGGLLPIISLTSLHFFIRYGDMDKEKVNLEENTDSIKPEVINDEPIINNPQPQILEDKVEDTKEEEPIVKVTETYDNDLNSLIDLQQDINEITPVTEEEPEEVLEDILDQMSKPKTWDTPVNEIIPEPQRGGVKQPLKRFIGTRKV